MYQISFIDVAEKNKPNWTLELNNTPFYTIIRFISFTSSLSRYVCDISRD